MPGLARTAADAEFVGHVRDAERALRRAADVCRRVVQDNRRQGNERSDARRASDAQKEIEGLLGRLADLGHLAHLAVTPEPAPAEKSRPAKKVANG